MARWGSAIIVFLLCVQGFPALLPGHAALREELDTLIDGMGLWQGQWELFGPEPDKINVALVGVVEFEDGAVSEWRSPNPREYSIWEKSRRFRFTEFIDSVHQNDNSGAWPALADYIVANAEHPGGLAARPKRVSLWRLYVMIPPPQEPLRPFADPFPHDQKYRFYVRELALE